MEWRAVLGWEDRYEVSDAGQVRALRTGRVLAANLRNGYPRVCLYRSGTDLAYRTVHVLVCEAFHGPRPEGLEVRHLDGVKTNVAASNLKWGTRLENIQDALAHRQLQDRPPCRHGHTGRDRCGRCHSEAMLAYHERKRAARR
jgi:hypothetical protein